MNDRRYGSWACPRCHAWIKNRLRTRVWHWLGCWRKKVGR
jgi:hypothetical protein